MAEQLAAFGLPADTIAARLRTKKTTVAHALAVAGSQLARRAAPRYDLDLSQAAAIAEFDSDPDSVKLLVAAAKEGPVRFEHELARLRHLRKLMQRKLPPRQPWTRPTPDGSPPSRSAPAAAARCRNWRPPPAPRPCPRR